jgi:O-antigen/teichoic acid export membrane protein
MVALKKLAGQTAIYGLSSMVGRLLNYFLVPLHTARLVTSEYGVVTDVYASVAFLAILLTYGMETTFFRFHSRTENPKQILATSLISVLSTTLLFWGLTSIFFSSIVDSLGYELHPNYVFYFLLIVGLDALTAIPQANLRAENKPVAFATVNIISILVNIGFNLFFIGYCMKLSSEGISNFWTETFYNPSIGLGYIFIANAIASGVKLLLLTPQYRHVIGGMSMKLLKTMLKYTWPLLLMGLGGMINETFDRLLLKHLLTPIIGAEAALEQEGIYGACYKLSILITLFVQAFRFAAEPFFFSQYKETDKEQTYAKVMSIFIGFCLTMFLGVTLYIDVVKQFLRNEDYWVGLSIVPILLIANICLGVVYNLSIWYKLSDKTKYGAKLAFVGAIITLTINLAFIPTYGFIASAWATLACYSVMMITSYFLGQKHFPVPYNLKKIGGYAILAALIYGLDVWMFEEETHFLALSVKLILILAFGAVVFFYEKPKKALI